MRERTVVWLGIGIVSVLCSALTSHLLRDTAPTERPAASVVTAGLPVVVSSSPYVTGMPSSDVRICLAPGCTRYHHYKATDAGFTYPLADWCRQELPDKGWFWLPPQ